MGVVEQSHKSKRWTPEQFAAAICGALKSCKTPEEIESWERWVAETTRLYKQQILEAAAEVVRRDLSAYVQRCTADFAYNLKRRDAADRLVALAEDLVTQGGAENLCLGAILLSIAGDLVVGRLDYWTEVRDRRGPEAIAELKSGLLPVC